jgi:uncharacterized protein DUF4265
VPAPKESKPIHATVVLHGGKHAESLWVRKIRGMQYRNAAIPFYAYNVSLGDVVLCRRDEDGEGLFVDHVVEKSGNRTVRVAFKAPERGNHPEAVRLRDWLRQNSFKWDYNRVQLISINIPSDEAYVLLQNRLKELPESAQMIWEDGDPQPERNLDGSERVATSA